MRKPIASESDLRAWLRSQWRSDLWGPLIWVEAARGGTVGAPDVLMPIYGVGWVPVELKYWRSKLITDGFVNRIIVDVKMRPAQRRLHLLAGLSGQKSAVVGYLPDCGGLAIGLGCRVARDFDSSTLHMRSLDIDSIRSLFQLISFWSASDEKLARITDHVKLRTHNQPRSQGIESRLSKLLPKANNMAKGARRKKAQSGRKSAKG